PAAVGGVAGRLVGGLWSRLRSRLRWRRAVGGPCLAAVGRAQEPAGARRGDQVAARKGGDRRSTLAQCGVAAEAVPRPALVVGDEEPTDGVAAGIGSEQCRAERPVNILDQGLDTTGRGRGDGPEAGAAIGRTVEVLTGPGEGQPAL